jgi:hypothetical protein
VFYSMLLLNFPLVTAQRILRLAGTHARRFAPFVRVGRWGGETLSLKQSFATSPANGGSFQSPISRIGSIRDMGTVSEHSRLTFGNGNFPGQINSTAMRSVAMIHQANLRHSQRRPYYSASEKTSYATPG